LMGASCWQSSNCRPTHAQTIVSVLTELITTVQHWCWTPAMVCAVTTPLHSLYQGSPNYGPRAKSNLRSHFTRTRYRSLDLKIGSLESEKIINGNIYEI